MSDRFRERIRAALADPGLQAALDANALRRKEARLQAYAALPQSWEALRQRAHAVRAETIAHLDRYLEQFISEAQGNGLVVHRAADAGEAIRLVLEIARQAGARLIAKSKTMVSEEIGLNRALEAAGLRVVETDLGEYIVQLRGEPPAHLITPAVHLRREDVGRTFAEKLGVPYTEDVAALTAAARQALRQVFLEAEIGLSGVNFGVAETGALCLVTNEGNGRMVTTLPPVHVALMGIERIVPTLEDLALMLAVLPRAATGQAISVYTSLIRAPRLPGESDGARERHLILVDNGRSALRASPLAEALLCIRCGACLNACPVFREIGGHAYVGEGGETSPYSGPIGSVISPGLFGQAEFGRLARASSLCGACREACPVAIDLPALLLRVRAGELPRRFSRKEQKVPAALAWGLRLFAWLAADARRFALSQRLAAAFGRLAWPSGGWMRLPAFTGWGMSKDFPRPAARTFRQRWAGGEIRRETARPADLLAVKAQPATGGQARPQSPLPQLPRLERFAAQLTALGGTFTRCSEAELSEQILGILREAGADGLLSWEGERLPAGLRDALRAAGVRLCRAEEGEAGAGLTGALAGIAETGTLVVPGGAGRPLLASLLPEVHLAILRAEDICENLQQAFELDALRQASSVVLISGPSRTADIEMTLTIGVHGPRQVHVLCVG